MNIRYLYQLLGAPSKIQIKEIQGIAENSGVVNFTSNNELRELLTVTLNSLAPDEGNGGSEGYESWLQRTGFNREFVDDRDHKFWLASAHLNTLLQLVLEVNSDFEFTQHGLRSSASWKLIRKLANEVIESMEWSAEIDNSLSHSEKMQAVWPWDKEDE